MKIDWERIPTLSGDRVSLRALQAHDLDSLFSIYSDPEVMRYWGASAMQTRSEANEFFAEVVEDLRRRRCIQWGIARRSDDRIIGTIALFAVDVTARKCEVAFALGRAYWGRGYMHEALQIALGYALNEMDFRRIEADVDPRNLACIRLLERVGFKREGYLRERWLVPGETQDSLFYGLLKRDWISAAIVYDVAPGPLLWKSRAEPPLISHKARLARSRIRRWAALFLGLLGH